MPLFGRRKPLHERLLEQGGLEEPEPYDARPLAGGSRESGIHGIARQREWDAVATVAAPDLEGDELTFDVLPDRTVLVDDDAGDASLAPLVDAIERDLAPPYRVRAVRQRGPLWAVAARRIEVVRLSQQGDLIELTSRNGNRVLTIDGAREFGSVPELETLGAARHPDYVIRAERLDGDWWEVAVDPL